MSLVTGEGELGKPEYLYGTKVQGSFLRLGYPGDTWYNERTLVPGFGTWFWSGKTGADGFLATSRVSFSSQRIIAEVFYTSADMWTGGPSGFSSTMYTSATVPLL